MENMFFENIENEENTECNDLKVQADAIYNDIFIEKWPDYDFSNNNMHIPFCGKITAGDRGWIPLYAIADHISKRTHGENILLTAGCGSGKTYAVEKHLFKFLYLKGMECILACPNVPQVLQNNKKYKVKAILGRNYMVVQPEKYTSQCSIFDKLPSLIDDMSPEQISNTCLVVDEANQLIDSMGYRKSALSQVKDVCRKIVNAGGVVIYMTGSAKHIEKMPPNGTESRYDARYDFIKVSSMDAVNTFGRRVELYPFYDASELEATSKIYKQSVSLVKENWNDSTAVVRFSNILSFPEIVMEKVKCGHYLIIQNDDKVFNARLVKLLNSKGIRAGFVSADDTLFIKDKYINNIYDDIINHGTIPFGRGADEYQVIITTCLLNNGSSIDTTTVEDAMIKANTECIYVCQSSDRFSLESIDQFFCRIRYRHVLNSIFIPKADDSPADKEIYSYDDYLKRCTSSARAEVNRLRDMPGAASMSFRKRIRSIRKSQGISDMVGTNDDFMPYADLDQVSVEADKMYCKQLYYNTGALVKALSEKYGEVASFDVDSTYSIYDEIKFDSSKAAKCADILKGLFTADSYIGMKVKVMEFCLGKVDMDNGTINQTYAGLFDIDPALPGYVQSIIMYYTAGNIDSITNTETRKFIGYSIYQTLSGCPEDIRELSSRLKELKNAYIEKAFDSISKDNIIKKYVMDYCISGIYNKDISKAANNISQSYLDSLSFPVLYHKTNVSGMTAEYIREYFSEILSERKMIEWTALCGYIHTNNGVNMSWERLCDIGKNNSAADIANILVSIENTRLMNCNCGIKDNTMFGIRFSILLSEGCFKAMGFSDYKDTGSWIGKTITMENCTTAMGYLKDTMNKKYHCYYHEGREHSVRLDIFRFYASVFTYRKVSHKSVIKRAKRDIPAETLCLVITGIRKTVKSDEPAKLTFNMTPDCNVSKYDDILQTKERYEYYKKHTYTDANGIRVLEQDGIGTFIDNIKFYSVIINNHVPIGIYKSDIDGNGFAACADSNGNIQVETDSLHCGIDIREVMSDPDTVIIQVPDKGAVFSRGTFTTENIRI